MEDVPGWTVGHKQAYWPVVDRLFIAVIYLNRWGAGSCSCLAPGGAIYGWNAAERSALFGSCSTRYAEVTTNSVGRPERRTGTQNELITFNLLVTELPLINSRSDICECWIIYFAHFILQYSHTSLQSMLSWHTKIFLLCGEFK